jgi:predicted RNA-binding Zn ribbon-like protein
VPGLSLIEEFLNTVDERSFRRHGQIHAGGDQLTSPDALARWLAEHDPANAGTALDQDDLAGTVALRTALRRSLLGEADPATAFADHPLQLVPDGAGGMRVAARSGRRWLDVLVETVAEAACRGDWKRIKLCAAPDCRWAFHDTSRNARGRWCNMNACGNRHKTRAYRERRH